MYFHKHHPISGDSVAVTFKKYRSSWPEMFCKKGIAKCFAKFAGKRLGQSLLLRPASLLKRRFWRKF